MLLQAKQDNQTVSERLKSCQRLLSQLQRKRDGRKRDWNKKKSESSVTVNLIAEHNQTLQEIEMEEMDV
jgi:hypothetical protein